MPKILSLLVILIALIMPTSLGQEGGKDEGVKPIDFFSNKKYTDLRIEVLYTKDCQPNDMAIAFLVSKIETYCRKTITVNYNRLNIAPINSTSPLLDQMVAAPITYGIWYVGSLPAFVQKFAASKIENKTLVLHIVYVSGFSINQPTAIGETFSRNAFVIFKPRVANSCEKSLLLHELGHIFGLKDTKSKQHDDDHTYHCNNSKCVMYWCIGEDQRPEAFDEECEEALFAAGARRYF